MKPDIGSTDTISTPASAPDEVAKLRAEVASLKATQPLVRPMPNPAMPLWTDGQPACKCDGPEEPGPHHKRGCFRSQG